MIVLASASPRRRALLTQAGLSFEVRPSDVDESGDLGSPKETARLLARRKAQAAVASLGGDEAWVVGADTVVAAPAGAAWRLMGKASGPDEARAMLASLGGSRHQVVTGVAVIHTSSGAERTACETTWVSMRAILPAELDAYVASGEWRDKAGAYAIQETADRFVTALEGGFDNVVGLPVGLTLELLDALGCPDLPPRVARARGRR